MLEFKDFFELLKSNIKELAKTNLEEFRDAAIEDGNAFLEKSKEDLTRWTQELASGDLKKEDFEFLIAGKKDLAEMEALKQAGLALVQVDRFRNSLIETVIDTAFSVLI